MSFHSLSHLIFNRSEQEADVITRRLTDTSAALDRVKMESSIEIERVSIVVVQLSTPVTRVLHGY